MYFSCTMQMIASSLHEQGMLGKLQHPGNDTDNDVDCS